MERSLVIKSDININESDLLGIEKVAIIDGDYESLVYFLVILNNSNNNLREINIVNSNLGFIEKVRINMILKNYPNIIIKFLKEIDVDEFLKNDLEKKLFADIIDENLDKEIELLLDKIENITETLDFDTKKLIEDKVTRLIKEYQKQLQYLKPQFQLNNLSLDLTTDYESPKTLRNNLIISLEILIQKLYFENNLLLLSEKINNYQSFLRKNKEMDIRNDKNFEKIKTITELAKDIKEPTYPNRLCYLVDEIQEMVTSSLKEENVIKLTLENQNIENLFEIKLNSLLEEVKNLHDKLLPYNNMLNVLEGEEEETNLSRELKTIENIFLTVSNIKQNKLCDLYKLYKNLKTKYIELLTNNILKIKNRGDFISIQQLEIEFRKELHLILEQLNIFVPIALENQNIYNQILTAENILKNKETNEIGSIIELTREIIILLNNSLISYSIKYELENKLNEIFSRWQEKLSYNDISEIVSDLNCDFGLTSDTLIIEVAILKELYEIKESLERYLIESSEYNCYKSKSELISFGKNENQFNPKFHFLDKNKSSLKQTSYYNLDNKVYCDDHKIYILK